VTDYALLERMLAEYEIEAVFHLAGQTIFGIANHNPLSTFETNIRGTWLMLEAARRVKTVRRIVIASSYKVYGANEELPHSENTSLLGQYPYDVSKICAERLASSYATAYNQPIAITRCANLFGGGDLNWNRIVPGTMRSVVYGERPIIRSDGSPMRDYLFVQDAVAGYLRLAEAMDGASFKGQAFNFGMDEPLCVLDLVHTIISISDHSTLEPIILGGKPDDIQEQRLCSDKARQRLGWKPAYTMSEALKETLAWYGAFLVGGRGV
jgi:CDP-glucose 4,6-dehydratase